MSEAEGFATPLGVVPVDVEANELLVQRGVAFYGDSAHLPEHCLEVQLPFLQRILDSFQIVPILVGRADPNEVGILLDTLNRTAGTVILVSSDLSWITRRRSGWIGRRQSRFCGWTGERFIARRPVVIGRFGVCCIMLG